MKPPMLGNGDHVGVWAVFVKLFYRPYFISNGTIKIFFISTNRTKNLSRKFLMDELILSSGKQYLAVNNIFVVCSPVLRFSAFKVRFEFSSF